MRSFLGFLVFIGVLIALLGAVVLPMLVAPMVAATVRDAAPFGEQRLDVEVDVDPIGLLRGLVSEIRISGTDLEADGARLGSLTLVLRDVRIGDRSFADASGATQSIDLVLADGSPISVSSVTLSGASTAVEALASLEATAAAALIRAGLADAGLALAEVELIDGGVAFDVLGERVEVALAVEGGAVVVASVAGLASVPVVSPAVGDPWRIVAVTVKPTGILIEATVDAEGLLAGG
jgi:hypothetical protein